MRAAALTALLLLVLAAPAAASDDPAQLAAAVESEIVHVDPRAAGRLPVADAGKLRLRIAQRDLGRIKVLVVPEAAAARNGGLPRLAQTVAELVDTPGALLVVAGDGVQVVTTYESDDALAAVRAAMGGPSRKRLLGPLSRAVDGIARADPGVNPARSPATGDDLGFSNFFDDLGDTIRTVFFSIAAVVIIAILIPFLVWGVRARRRRNEGAEELATDCSRARDQLIEIGERLQELDIDVEMPGADAEGREAYGRALELYKRADRELAKADTRRKLQRAQTTINEARSDANIAHRRLGGGTAAPTAQLPGVPGNVDT